MELMYCEGTCDFDFPFFPTERCIDVKVRGARRISREIYDEFDKIARGDATACVMLREPCKHSFTREPDRTLLAPRNTQLLPFILIIASFRFFFLFPPNLAQRASPTRGMILFSGGKSQSSQVRRR